MTQEWKTLAAQIAELQRQLLEVTRERDQYKAACELADALRNQQFVRGAASVRPHKAGPFVLFERARA